LVKIVLLKEKAMDNRARNAILISAVSLAIASAAGRWAISALVSPAIALGDTVTLDNVTIPGKDGGSAVIKHVEFTGTNLSRDEVASLFSATLPLDQARQLMAKLKASKIAIPELLLNFNDGSAIIRNLEASNVDAGKVGLLSVAAINASSLGKDGPAINVATHPFSLENADLSGAVGASQLSPFKFSRLTWGGLEASFPDKDTPADAAGGNLVRIKIASANANSDYQGDLFSKGIFELKGMTIEVPKASKAGKTLAQFGYDKIEYNMNSSSAYNPGSKTLASTFTINGADIGALALKADLGSIDTSAFLGDGTQRLVSLMNGDIGNVEMRLTDGGLFDKTVEYFAAQQHQKPEDVKRIWTMAASQIIGALFAGSPEADKISDALSQFIAAPKNLTVSAHGKTGAVAIKDLQELKSLPAILGRVDFSAAANQP
jgi:hypothetical protein